MTRNLFLCLFLLVTTLPLVAEKPTPSLPVSLDRIEKKSGGRLGFALLDSATGRTVTHRGEERFPMCSTFKFLAAGLILQRVDQGKEQLDRKVIFSRKDLLSHSPMTEPHTGGQGMTVSDLCQAAVTQSDNTAANLLLASFGGPTALTQFLRSMGDPVTRLDRNELSLNTAIPGDPRDTTSPNAMILHVQRLLFGKVLQPSSRAILTQWMLDCATGKVRLKAGLPTGWKIGDKTGTGVNGTSNDVAVIWPPHHAPVFVAVYLTESPLAADARDALLAEVGKAVAANIATEP